MAEQDSGSGARVPPMNNTNDIGATGAGIVSLVTAVIPIRPKRSNTTSGHSTTVPVWKGPKQDGVSLESPTADPFHDDANGKERYNSLRCRSQSFGPEEASVSTLDRSITSDSVIAEASPTTSKSEMDSATPSSNSSERKARSPSISSENVDHNGKPQFFTTDPVLCVGTRYVQLNGVPTNEYDSTIERLDREFGWKSKMRGQQVSHGLDSLSIALCFDDIRDAKKAFRDVKKLGQPFSLHFLTQSEYADAATKASFGTHDHSSVYDGQVYFDAAFTGSSDHHTTMELASTMREIATEYGHVFAFAVDKNETSGVRCRVEYSAISSAKNVVNDINDNNPRYLDDWFVVVHDIMPAVTRATSEPHHSTEGAEATIASSTKEANGSVIYQSPSGRTAWTYDDNGNQVPVPAPRQLPKARSHPVGSAIYAHNHDSGHHNSSHQSPYMHMDGVDMGHESYHVRNGRRGKDSKYETCDPFLPDGTRGDNNQILAWKLARGSDTRTTIMVRNLPNSLTCHGLKKILDECSFGKYDFSYLRIDFAANKNVGYGFVNFIHPHYLLEFVNRYGNRKWLPGMKDQYGKIRDAQFSYAAIQGLDCLTEKFRNSSIMDEYKDYRPKLWWTYANAPVESLVNTEITFPPPNNFSKNRRSTQNAQNVGLYTSERRGNRRGRSSQYDRGTLSQIREDAYHNHASSLGNGYSHGYASANYNYNYGQPMVPLQQAYPLHYGAYPYCDFNGSGAVQPYDPFTAQRFNGCYASGSGTQASQHQSISNGMVGGYPVANSPHGNFNTPRIFNSTSNGHYNGNMDHASNGYYHSTGYMNSNGNNIANGHSPDSNANYGYEHRF